MIARILTGLAAMVGSTCTPAPAPTAAPPATIPDRYVGQDIYTYAPSVIVTGLDRFTFTCSNSGRHGIVDVIRLTHTRNDTVISDKPVMSPRPGMWDSVHVCDPTVIAGEWPHAGRVYRWAMYYLGTADPSNGGQHNQVGVAYSNDLEMWVRPIGPLIAMNPGDPAWGVGQPSATAVNPTTTLLTYSRGASVRAVTITHTPTGTTVSPERLLPVVNPAYALHNADIAYDPHSDKVWIVAPNAHGTNRAPTFIAPQLVVASAPASILWTGQGTWTVHTTIDQTDTGHAKNDNAGWTRDAYGGLAERSVWVTAFSETEWPAALYAYRLTKVRL
jgi:hypothetical protein